MPVSHGMSGDDMMMVDGILRPTRNSDGRRIHPTEDGVRNFWRWFGNSHAVDCDGRPKVFYHGTITWEHNGKQLGNITAFNRKASTEIVGRPPSSDQVGIWFSDRPDKAGAGMYGSMIYPVYLRVLDAKRTTFTSMTRTAYRLGHGTPPPTGMAKPADMEPYRGWLKEQGYDALQLIHDPLTENGSTEFLNQNVYVVLEPLQIKSAIGNSGAFNPTCPDIHDQSPALSIKPVPTPSRRRCREPGF